MSGLHVEVGASRLVAVRRAVEAWKRQLIDLTGRNRLLYYRHLPKGTIDLAAADPEVAEALFEGGKVRLSDLFDAEALPLEAARARAIYRRTREHEEERGVATLFVARGLAGWTTATSSATPNAPVLLCHAGLHPRGAAAEDFDLELVGEWTVNETLLLLLASEFGVTVDAGWLVDDGEGAGLDVGEVFDRLAKVCASDVADFVVDDAAVLGNFAYTKMPMVADLEASVDALAAHDLIAAVAGDDEARQAVAAAQPDDPLPDLPDRTPPGDEFLILDADSSQNVVVNAAVAGGSMVVQGPPGTGKSQTISNLIAVLGARGQRVLFVAEKRAAIDAVVKRLEQTGLGDLVLDLHTGAISRREFARQLGDSLATSSATPAIDESETHADLQAARTALLEHHDALHTPRDPFGISVFDAQARALALGEKFETMTLRWRGSQLTAMDAQTRRDALQALDEWVRLGARLREGSSPWTGATVTTPADAATAVEILDELAHHQLPASRAAMEAVIDDGHAMSLAQAVRTAAGFDAAAAAAGWVAPQLYDSDVGALTAGLAPAARGRLARLTARLGDADYRQATKAVKTAWAATTKPTPPLLLEGATAATAAAAAWQAARLQGPPIPPPHAAEFSQAIGQFGVALDRLARATRLDLGQLNLDQLEVRVEALLGDQVTLNRLPRLHQLDTWCHDHHLDSLLGWVKGGQIDSELVGDAFDLAWHLSVLDHVAATDRRIAEFDGRWHDQQVASFAAAERVHRDTTPARIRRLVAEHLTSVRNRHPDQDQLIRAEARKKRRHRPVRQILAEAPEVLLAVRPCWAMSPLLVSQLLPGTQLFDVVIFDEASQVLPADAVPALLRAPHAIVAGDEHQLPPTTFFAGVDDHDEDEEEEEVGGVALVEGFESILDVLASMLPQRWLTWHYRSRDERLIAFCNRHVYRGALTTFPGVGGDPPLDHQPVTQAGGDTRSDPAEVRHVVDLLVDHARTHPATTVGVIAMGQHHAARIEEALRRRLAAEADSHLDAFFSDEQDERPFVKNIERVQGDERDRIILSTGYAKQPDGRLRNRLGPINHDVGYRRLNVAFSRSRQHVTVVSVFHPSDMHAERFSSRGAQMLRDYLRYVTSGADELGGRDHTPLNPFELSVLARLEAAGLDVVPQWGVSGFRIDFAVRHPTDPNRFVLAVEADGATYHSSHTARDRDRLRQQILRQLGWQVVRIWSTDFFRDPDTEIARVVVAVEAAAADHRPGGVEDHDDTEDSGWVYQAPARGPRPRLISGQPIGAYSHAQLCQLIDWLKSDTLLRTDEELLDQAMVELGFRRRGHKITAAIQAAIDACR